MPLKIILRELIAIGSSRLFIVLFPLLILPIVSRRLGVDGFGILVFFMNLSMWLSLFIQYGFELTGIRHAVLYEKKRWCEQGSVIWAAQALLSAAALALIAALFPFISIIHEHAYIALLSWISAVLQAVVPRWYFRAAQRMGLMAALESGPKILTVPLLYWAMKLKPDPALAYTILVSGYAFTLIPAAWICLQAIGGLGRVQWRSIVVRLRVDFPIFFSQVAASLYYATNVLLLGLFVTPANVGFFGAAERIVRSIVTVNASLPQTLYPITVKLFDNDHKAANRTVWVSAAILGLVGAVLAIAVYVLAPDVIMILLGRGFEPVVKITRILALTIPLFGVGHVVAVQGLVALNEGFYYAVVTTFGGVLNVALAFILVPRFGIDGMAAGLVISVFAITIGFCVMYFVRSGHRRR